MPDEFSLTLRGPNDLESLGRFLRAYRRHVGLDRAKDAAPYLGVGFRLLVELEAGTRGKRGVTLGKLLQVLEGLGLELVIQPKSAATGGPGQEAVVVPAPQPKRPRRGPAA